MTVIDLYTVQIVRYVTTDGRFHFLTPEEVAELMAETEENLTDLLPPGVRARIRRWDHPDPDEGNEDE